MTRPGSGGDLRSQPGGGASTARLWPRTARPSPGPRHAAPEPPDTSPLDLLPVTADFHPDMPGPAADPWSAAGPAPAPTAWVPPRWEQPGLDDSYAGAPVGSMFAPAYMPAPYLGYAKIRPRRRRFVWLGVVAAVLAAGVAGFVIRERNNPAGRCTPAPSADVSPAGRAYLDAVAAATPAWERVDSSLAHEGNVTHHNDLLAQVNADATFTSHLRSIQFPADVQPLAAQLINAVVAYDDFLRTAYVQPGYLEQNPTADETLNVDRANASSALRAALSLPASTCTLRRP